MIISLCAQNFYLVMGVSCVYNLEPRTKNQEPRPDNRGFYDLFIMLVSFCVYFTPVKNTNMMPKASPAGYFYQDDACVNNDAWGWLYYSN